MRDIKIKVQQSFWNDGIHKILTGNSNYEFISKFLAFLNNIDFDYLCPEEIYVLEHEIFSKNELTKNAQAYIINWIEHNYKPVIDVT